ncbi:hypothetical protein BBJ28_00022614 [Nothophytophthora sp. Chile5]|nr:hypothetical protein BBJ28_00022614 [Nothophytophthora sp. Chile5]
MPTHYNRYTLETKLRILEAAHTGGDWEAIAETNNVNLNTARSWLRRYRSCADATRPVARGGKRTTKMTDEGVDYLLSLLSIDSDLTLCQLADLLNTACSISVCSQTIKNHLDARLITVKQFHKEPQYMNTDVIACIGKGGVVHYETKLGSNKRVHSNEFIQNTLRKFEDVSNVVVVLDNAPCHSRAEAVFEEPEFVEATLLRLGPYSPILNPIENVFSAFKSAVKDFMTVKRAGIIAVPPGTTMKAHRQRFLLQAAQTLVPRSDAGIFNTIINSARLKMNDRFPLNLEGKDVLAKTGNRKTIAFLLPVIKNMVHAGRRQGVIPTLTLLFNATLTASTMELKRVTLRDNYAFVDTIDEIEVDINIQTEQEYVHFQVASFPGVLEMHSRKSQTQHTRWPKPPSRKGKKTVIFLSDASARGADYPSVLVVLQVGALARGDGAVGVADAACLEECKSNSELKKSDQLSYQELVQLAVEYSRIIGLDEVPKLEKKMLQKVNRFGVPDVKPSAYQRDNNGGDGGYGGGRGGGGFDGAVDVAVPAVTKPGNNHAHCFPDSLALWLIWMERRVWGCILHVVERRTVSSSSKLIEIYLMNMLGSRIIRTDEDVVSIYAFLVITCIRKQIEEHVIWDYFLSQVAVHEN